MVGASLDQPPAMSSGFSLRLYQKFRIPEGTNRRAKLANEVIAAGDPLEHPIGLVLSCDGAMLYVADIGGEAGAILSIGSGGGELANLGVTGIVRPGGLAMGPDCATLYATGRTDDGMPALFAIATTGGSASPVWIGAPLVSPTTAWKILKPRRRVVARFVLLMCPITAARLPGRSDAIGCMRVRSS